MSASPSRRDIFVRDGRRLGDEERRDRLFETAFMLARPAATIEYAATTPSGRVDYDNAAARAIVATLADGPLRLSEVAAASAADPQDVMANALVLCAAGALLPVEHGGVTLAAVTQAMSRRLGDCHAWRTISAVL